MLDESESALTRVPKRCPKRMNTEPISREATGNAYGFLFSIHLGLNKLKTNL